MNHKLLMENLFEGDLKDTILPLISIDQFESKILDDAIVFAFYVINEDAAEDLAVFLERSYITSILDVEVSQTPNKDAQYLVFVEVTKDFTEERFFDLLELIEHLSEKLDWKFNFRNSDKDYKVTKDYISRAFKKLKS